MTLRTLLLALPLLLPAMASAADITGVPKVRDGDQTDGTEDTDGIDVTTADLGATFSGGLFVAHDGQNDGGNQNYKLVPWKGIVGAG